ncbi:Serine/arginine repetitive matrix protein 1 [Actinomortierella wolfii]|nr:Serine/arginine repetitive matrix protein 1 [Actinomortierella wolfii]
MGDAGYFKGTSAEQDARFSNKEKKLLRTMSFPPEFNKKVDMKKVRLDLIKQGIARRLVELLGVDDDVVVEYTFGMLEEQFPDPKMMQINLQGFLGQNAQPFVLELWKLLLSAQNSLGGIPKELLEKAKQDVLRSKAEKDAALKAVMNQEAKERAEFKEFRERVEAIRNAMGTGANSKTTDVQAAAPATASASSRTPSAATQVITPQGRDHSHLNDRSKDREEGRVSERGAGDSRHDGSKDRSRERYSGRDRSRDRGGESGRRGRSRSRSRDDGYRSESRRHRDERYRYPSRDRREERYEYSSRGSGRDYYDRERDREHSRDRRYRDRSRSRSRDRYRRRRSPDDRRSSRYDERSHERESERDYERDRRRSRMDEDRRDSPLPDEPLSKRRRSRSRSRSRSTSRRARSPYERRTRSRSRSTSRRRRRSSPPPGQQHVDSDSKHEIPTASEPEPTSATKDSVQLEKELREELLRKRALNSMKAKQAAKARATVETAEQGEPMAVDTSSEH